MKISKLVVLASVLLPALALAVLLPAVALAQKKAKKPNVSAELAQARYVYVEAAEGGEFNPRLDQENRQAIADVERALQDWNRYALTTKRSDADIVIVVRKGRLAQADGGVIASPDPGSQGSSYPGQPRGQGGTGLGTDAGGEVGTPDDLFEVRQRNPDDSLGASLWMRTLPDGLDGPRVILFEQFKDAVERAYPSQPAAQPAAQPQKP